MRLQDRAAASLSRYPVAWAVVPCLVGALMRYRAMNLVPFSVDEHDMFPYLLDSFSYFWPYELGMNPPGWPLLLKGVAHLLAFFSGQEFFLWHFRTFPILLGVLCIPAIIWSGSRLFSLPVGLLAGWMLALNNYHIGISALFRSYSALYLMGILLHATFRGNPIIFLGVFAVSCYVNYFTLFLFPLVIEPIRSLLNGSGGVSAGPRLKYRKAVPYLFFVVAGLPAFASIRGGLLKLGAGSGDLQARPVGEFLFQTILDFGTPVCLGIGMVLFLLNIKIVFKDRFLLVALLAFFLGKVLLNSVRELHLAAFGGPLLLVVVEACLRGRMGRWLLASALAFSAVLSVHSFLVPRAPSPYFAEVPKAAMPAASPALVVMNRADKVNLFAFECLALQTGSFKRAWEEEPGTLSEREGLRKAEVSGYLIIGPLVPNTTPPSLCQEWSRNILPKRIFEPPSWESAVSKGCQEGFSGPR